MLPPITFSRYLLTQPNINLAGMNKNNKNSPKDTTIFLIRDIELIMEYVKDQLKEEGSIPEAYMQVYEEFIEPLLLGEFQEKANSGETEQGSTRDWVMTIKEEIMGSLDEDYGGLIKNTENIFNNYVKKLNNPHE